MRTRKDRARERALELMRWGPTNSIDYYPPEERVPWWVLLALAAVVGVILAVLAVAVHQNNRNLSHLVARMERQR